MNVIVSIIAMILSTKVNHLNLMIFVMFVDLEICKGDKVLWNIGILIVFEYFCKDDKYAQGITHSSVIVEDINSTTPQRINTF